MRVLVAIVVILVIASHAASKKTKHMTFFSQLRAQQEELFRGAEHIGDPEVWSDVFDSAQRVASFVQTGKPERKEQSDLARPAKRRAEVSTAGRAAKPVTPLSTATKDTARPSHLIAGGLLAEYYNNEDLSSSPITTQIDPHLNFSWVVYNEQGGTVDTRPSMDPRLPKNQFSVRWSGFIRPPATGSYTFAFTTDDGMRVWLDDSIVLDSWRLQPPATYEVKRSLDSEKFHSIIVEYFQHTGDRRAVMRWRGPGVSGDQIVPSSALFADANAAASPSAAPTPIASLQEELTNAGKRVSARDRAETLSASSPEIIGSACYFGKVINNATVPLATYEQTPGNTMNLCGTDPPFAVSSSNGSTCGSLNVTTFGCACPMDYEDKNLCRDSRQYICTVAPDTSKCDAIGNEPHLAYNDILAGDRPCYIIDDFTNATLLKRNVSVKLSCSYRNPPTDAQIAAADANGVSYAFRPSPSFGLSNATLMLQARLIHFNRLSKSVTIHSDPVQSQNESTSIEIDLNGRVNEFMFTNRIYMEIGVRDSGGASSFESDPARIFFDTRAAPAGGSNISSSGGLSTFVVVAIALSCAAFVAFVALKVNRWRELRQERKAAQAP